MFQYSILFLFIPFLTSRSRYMFDFLLVFNSKLHIFWFHSIFILCSTVLGCAGLQKKDLQLNEIVKHLPPIRMFGDFQKK